MATVISQATHGSYPGMTYKLDAEQTGGSGNSRTVKITLYLKAGGSTTSSWYGYPVNWKARIHNSYSGWMTVKGTESWNGTQALRTFTWTATVDVGTTSSTNITVGFQTDSFSGDDSWDLTKTGTFGVGSTNVAPTLSGTLTTSPSGTFSEKTTTIALTSPTASDGNGNLSGYRFAVSVNGGGYSEIYKGSSRTYNHSITAAEGNSYQYQVYAYDAVGATSGTLTSAKITQNKFVMDTLASSSSISATTSSISFTYSGGSNAQGGTITRKLTNNEGIAIYNLSSVSSTPINISIYKSGTVPTTPYIKYSDIEAKFKNATAKGIGTLTFRLTATNSNGTAKASDKTINVNLQSTPNAVSGQIISTTATESTCYTQVGTNWYYLPDGTKVIRVKWNAALGNLGEACKYKVYVAYGSSTTYSWVADVASGTLYYNHKVPKQTVQQQIKYRIESISTYNESNKNTADTPAKTLDFYNAPGITVGTISRFSNSAEVKITVKTNTSITNVETRGTYTVWKQGTTKPTTATGNLGITQNEQTITATGLTEADRYYMAIAYYDNTGLSSSKNLPSDIAIGQNLPVMFVNDYGVGVGGVQATSSTALNVKGSVYPVGSWNGLTTYAGTPYGLSIAQVGNETAGFPTTYFTALTVNHSENRQFQIGTTNAGGMLAFRSGHVNNTSGTATGWSGWNQVYHTGYKPTAADVGAAPSSHTHSYLPLSGGTLTGALALSGNSKTLTIGTGSADCYLTNSKTTKYLQLTDAGTLTWSGSKIYDAGDAATGATANKLAMRDSSADISCRLVRANYQNESRMTGGVCFRVSTTDNYMRFCSDAGAFRGWLDAGSIQTTPPRITNFNARLNSGWYSFTSGITNGPSGVSYGVMLTMKWDSSTDFYQLVISSNNARLYTRGYVNGGYTPWYER